MEEPCEVCKLTGDAQKPKYKCPTCLVKYCSSNCWKSHKEFCASIKKSRTGDGAVPEEGSTYGSSLSTVLFPTDDTVPPEKLQRLNAKEASTNLHAPRVNTPPWWTPECAEALQQKKKSSQLLGRIKNEANRVEYRKSRARMRYVMKMAKLVYYEKNGLSPPPKFARKYVKIREEQRAARERTALERPVDESCFETNIEDSGYKPQSESDHAGSNA